jgi:hypothetical protein
MLPGMQCGSRPGQRCTSAVLKKVLCHDHIRMLKQTAVFVDTYGFKKLGLPASISNMLGSLWDSTVHLIKTLYGISSVSYGSTAARPLYGP